MHRIMALDYGTKRTGIAVSDPTQTIAVPLRTVITKEIFLFLKAYITRESVALFVVGLPKYLSNRPSPMTARVNRFARILKNRFPAQQLILQDERYTSRMAQSSLLMGGFKRKDRQYKSNLDSVSATLLLQSFLSIKSSYKTS